MSLGILKGPEPLPGFSESIIFITSTGSADSKIKFLSTRSVRYSEKCFVPEVSLGRSFSAINEKYPLKPSAMYL